MTSKTEVQVNIEYETDVQKSKDKIFDYFKLADFIDCKINAFPCNTEYTAIDLEVKNKTAASFIMIDLDLKDFENDKEKLDKQLKKTLKNMSINLHEESHPTVLWTGNGYHIYQPIDSLRLEDIADFNFIDNPSNRFIRFAKNLLSEGYADKCNNPPIKSCLVSS